MSSRMSKYYEEDNSLNTLSRVNRHEELYKEINKSELENYNIKSNATVLGSHQNEIDVEKIKKILDTKYNSVPQRKSIRLEVVEDKEEEKETTKEYDINVILEKAREQKTVNYEEERLKKLRDTQFDILNNLNLDEKDEEEIPEEDDLKTLIQKISYNENQNHEGKNADISSSLDILSDLKGNENTEVLKGLKEKVQENIEEEKAKTKAFDTKMINSFYTSSNSLNSKDFEDIDDFSKDIENNNTILKVIITLIIIVFLIGLGLLIKVIFFS